MEMTEVVHELPVADEAYGWRLATWSMTLVYVKRFEASDFRLTTHRLIGTEKALIVAPGTNEG